MSNLGVNSKKKKKSRKASKPPKANLVRGQLLKIFDKIEEPLITLLGNQILERAKTVRLGLEESRITTTAKSVLTQVKRAKTRKKKKVSKASTKKKKAVSRKKTKKSKKA